MNAGLVFIVEYIGQVHNHKICIVSPFNLKKKIIFKCKNFPKSSGVVIRATGKYTDKTEKIFNCETWQYEKLPNKECFEGYAKTFPDIGIAKAKKIFEKYGADYTVFLDADKMKEFSPKRYKEIVETATENEKNDYDIKLLETLANFGVINPQKINKIVQLIKYKDFEENPFVLMGLPGVKIGFRTCNSIVLQLQKSSPQYLKSEERICKGVEFTLRQLLSRGHTYILANKLIISSLRFLNEGVVRKTNLVQENDIKKAINLLRKQHVIKAEKTNTELRFYDTFYYDCENFIAQEVCRKSNTVSKKISKEKIKSILDDFDKTYNFKLADSQRLAVESIVNNNILIITGSAGTGKTTVLKASLYALQNLGYQNIVLAAPTGRAARRMAESTEHEASTLHSLLHLGIEDEETDALDVYVSDEKIEADAIFIDEASMCDISIIYRLLQKLPPDIKLFFLGDPNQLESVGSGRVLSDLIESCCVPVIKLKFIYRQAKDSNIVMNANKILNGNSNLVCGDDFEIINLNNPEEIQKQIADIYKNELALNDSSDKVFSVQCICPARREGFLASNQLNKIVQSAVNPNAVFGNICFKANGFSFYINDKIICSKNTPTIKNGDMGIITNIAPNSITAMFDTGEESFDSDKAAELGISLAYCISVHKAQGSEFETVIMPVAEENKNMLKRNLFYTAVTRAKKKMILVGEASQIKMAVNNNKVVKRNGNLQKRIVKIYKKTT